MSEVNVNVHSHSSIGSTHLSLQLSVPEPADAGITPQLLRAIATALDARAAALEQQRKAGGDTRPVT
jgi:hypothetical protein